MIPEERNVRHSRLTWKLRDAVVDDAQAISTVHVTAWQTTYRGILPEATLDGLRVENRTRRWLELLGQPERHTLVVEDECEGIVGFADGGRERRGDLCFAGELYAIYILQDFRRMGMGRILVRRIAAQLLGDGFPDLMVWVLKSNPYRNFYQKLGGQQFHSDSVTIGGRSYVELAYGWTDLRTLLE